MIHMLVVYRRSTQELLEKQIFEAADRLKAVHLRMDRDIQHWHDDDIETVVLSGPTVEAIEATHGRYFLDDTALTNRFVTTASRTSRRHARSAAAAPVALAR